MTRIDWNETAKGLAGFVQQFRFLVERGVVPLQFEGEPHPSSHIPHPSHDERPLVFGIFGKDDEDREYDEAEAVRNHLLEEPALQELGYGVSPDGTTWAMLIAAEKEHCETAAGRALQQELLKIHLDDVICHVAKH
jgi:hypothetical protein